MNDLLLKHFISELRHVQDMGGEFARAFPNRAGHLGITPTGCKDPFVERLLEGFAFLAARVQLKLESEFPRFTQALLDAVYPNYLSPTPSMTILQFLPDPLDTGLGKGYRVNRGTAVRAPTSFPDETLCEFRTCHDVTLWPLRVSDTTKYFGRGDLSALRLPSGVDARAVIRIGLDAKTGLTFDKLAAPGNLDRLMFHLHGTHGAGEIPMRVYEQIFGHATAMIIQPAGDPSKRTVLDVSKIRRVGFDANEEMLPADPRCFQGYRFLHEYFAFPERFLFVELTGLGPALSACKGSRVEIMLLMDAVDPQLEDRLASSNFALFCAPAINLFQRQGIGVDLSVQVPEHLVIVDRGAARDYEIFRITEAIGSGSGSDEKVRFDPFYSAKDVGGEQGRYFATQRVERIMSERDRREGERLVYPGSDVYLSLVDAQAAPYRSDLTDLSITALCTNRDLPRYLGDAPRFSMDDPGKVQEVNCIIGSVTAPRATTSGGDFAWQLINHLTLNYLSITDTDTGKGADALRELLGLYANMADPVTRARVNGVLSVGTTAVSVRVPRPDNYSPNLEWPITFARGLEIALTLNVKAFDDGGAFMMGSVLEQFFARYVTINSFTRTVVHMVGEDAPRVKRWSVRMGRSRLL